MPSKEKQPLSMSEDGLKVEIEPGDPTVREKYESLIREEYQRCNPGDTLDALKHRARFSAEAQGLLRDWMAVASNLARENGADVPSASSDRSDL